MINDVKFVTNIDSFEEYLYIKGLEKRELIINEDITDDVLELAILHIRRWNQEDDEAGLTGDSREKIHILLNSPGGQVDIGLALCSIIKSSKTKVVCTIMGTAASMGALIAISAHETYAYEYSDILIHDGSMFMMGSTNKVKDHMKFQEEKEKQIKGLVTSHTNISSEKYDEMADREWWMTATQAKEYGIVDEIL